LRFAAYLFLLPDFREVFLPPFFAPFFALPFLGDGLFFAVPFLAPFFALPLFALVFLAPAFLAPPFLEPPFFGTFAPSFLASDKPIAIDFFRYVTFLPLRKLFNWPRFFSCMAFSTFSPAFFEYFAIMFDLGLVADLSF
jgi:hypothetical protein